MLAQRMLTTLHYFMSIASTLITTNDILLGRRRRVRKDTAAR